MGAGRHVARRNRPAGMGLVPRGACRSGLGRSRRAITRELFLGCALAWGVVLCRSRILNFPPDASRLVNFSVHTVNMLNTPVTVLNFSLDAKVFEAGQAPAAPGGGGWGGSIAQPRAMTGPIPRLWSTCSSQASGCRPLPTSPVNSLGLLSERSRQRSGRP